MVKPEETEELSHEQLLEFGLDCLSRLSINNTSNISSINDLTEHISIEDFVLFSYDPTIKRIVEVIVSIDERPLEKEENDNTESMSIEMQKLAKRVKKMVQRRRYEDGYGTIQEVCLFILL